MWKALSFFRFNFKDYIPASILCWKEGYSRQTFLDDLAAGTTVGIIALPLAMAFAIGSGVPPERGLYTAIIAGFLISLLGGSRVQIGGPTGAFVVIVYAIVEKHGYDGLAIATVIAGLIMVLMGLARFGVFLKFIPYPVTTGFTTGIALTIFSSQIKDFFGLAMDKTPAHFIDKWSAYVANASSWNHWAFVVAATSLALIFVLRKIFPKVPGAIVAVILATIAVLAFDLNVETIESKFGGIPRSLPQPTFPVVTFEKIKDVFPDAITIALLGAIESLLSAMVADGMTGHRHRSNCELVAQGLANIGSIIFGGIPATGAIARTTANIKMNAKTPTAGIIHAIVLLLLMAFFAPYASKVPLAVLSSVLIFVAWNMSELEHFASILRGPKSDSLVLLLTFFLTVFIDLTVAVQGGVILSAFLFLKRMTDSTTVSVCKVLLDENANEYPEARDSDILLRRDVPVDVTIFEINGPFFFSVADLLNEELRRLDKDPKVFILRMRKVPVVDATGIYALMEFNKKCRKKGILFILSGVRDELNTLLSQAGVISAVGPQHVFMHLDDALPYARKYLQMESLKSHGNVIFS
jgi:SulP family sulfate permease